MRRPVNPMPDAVSTALDEAGLRETYEARPWYQRNDNLGWIDRGKRPETRETRLAQMPDDLRAGDVYMMMRWRPK